MLVSPVGCRLAISLFVPALFRCVGVDLIVREGRLSTRAPRDFDRFYKTARGVSHKTAFHKQTSNQIGTPVMSRDEPRSLCARARARLSAVQVASSPHIAWLEADGGLAAARSYFPRLQARSRRHHHQHPTFSLRWKWTELWHHRREPRQLMRPTAAAL